MCDKQNGTGESDVDDKKAIQKDPKIVDQGHLLKIGGVKSTCGKIMNIWEQSSTLRKWANDM